MNKGPATDPAERPGPLARVPAVGITIAVVGLLLFGLIAFNVRTNGPLTADDQPIAQGLYARAIHDPGFVVQAMRTTASFGREVLIVLFVVLGLYWLSQRYWRMLAMLVIGAGGGEFWFEILSRLFNRHRPVLPHPLDPLSVPGFPSGHTMDSVLFYGLFAYLLMPYLPSRGWRIFAFVDAILLAGIIGFARLFLGDHYLTDVLGGYCFGLAWGGLVYTAIEVYTARHVAAPAQETRTRVPG